MRRHPRALLLVLIAAAAPPAVASADEPIAAPPLGETAMTADAGVAVFTVRQGGASTRFMASTPAMARPVLVGPRIPRRTRFDVGIAPDARTSIVWTTDCTLATHRCLVRVVHALGGTARVLTRVPYAGGGSPAIALDHSRIAYAVTTYRGRGRARVRCDIPYTRIIRAAHARRLDHGRCATITQLDLEGGTIAVLAEPPFTSGSGVTEARVLRTTGGTSRLLQRESQGEESNFIGAVALDGGRLYTDQAGFRQRNVFSRFDLTTGRRTDARAFTLLAGPFARDGGRQLYLQNATSGDLECPAYTGAACPVVAGSDPFAAGSRLLAPQLSMGLDPRVAYADAPLGLTGALTRLRVTRTAQEGTVPVPGVPVTLSTAQLGAQRPSPFTTTGDVATTGPDGRYTFTLPAPHRPRTGYVTSAPIGAGLTTTAPDGLYPEIFARMTATSAARGGDGVVRISGTISPALPGRTARLDRRVRRTCSGSTYVPPLPSPSMLDTPLGCDDAWSEQPLARVAVSADGASFSIAATGPAGVYRVALDRPGTAAVLSGETAQLTVG